MSSIPFALSVHKFISNVGAYVGFGSIVAVALLVLLYFAHARETATLRDRLDEAHARIGGLEQRLVAIMQTQRGRPTVPGAPVPTPASIAQPPAPRPPGSVIPSVRRIPKAATAAGGAPAVAPPPPLVTGLGGLPPAAPVGMAGPALASATKMIPAGSAPVAAQDTMFVVPSTNGAGDNGVNPHDDAKAPVSAATAVAAAAAPSPTASPRGATPAPAPASPAEPPRVQIGGDGAATPPRRTVPSPRPPLIDDLASSGRGRRRMSGRLLPLLIGGVAVVVIIVGLIVITNTGSSTTGTVNHGSSGNRTGASVTNNRKHRSAPPFVASRFKISVLNGTAVAGLAADVGKVLKAQGFKQGNVTNAAAQTETATVVYYVTGRSTASNRTAAQHVASALKLGAARVRAASQAVLQSCATSVSGTSLGTCRANVIVSVGADRADLATSSST